MRLFLISWLIFGFACPIWAVTTKRGNAVVYGESGAGETYDPYTAHEASARRLSDLLFDSAITLTSTGEYKAHLAKAWKIGPGNTYVDLVLRDGVRWHNHTTKRPNLLRPEDVVATIRVLQSEDSEIPNRERFSVIGSAEKIDNKTIRVRFKRSVRDPLRYLMFKVLPSSELAQDKALKRNSRLAKQPVGTGPYKSTRIRETGEVTLAANKHYFKGTPKIEKISMKTYTDQTIMAKSLMFSALDLVAYVSPRDLDEVMGDRQLTVMPYDALSYSFFALNCSRSILRDRRVRLALTRAINRPEMLQAFFQGRGQIISGPFPPTSWAYNVDIQPLSYNLSAAKALLDEAGIKDRNKDGIRESRSGSPMKLSFAVPLTGEGEVIKRMSLAIQNYLREVGIAVELQFMDWLVWKKRVLGEHDYDITFASWSFDDATNIASLFHSSSAKPYGNNFVNFRSTEVDALLAEADATNDFDKRKVIYHRIHTLLANEAPYVFLWTLQHHAAHNQRMSRVRVSPFAFFRDVTEWKVQR